MIPVISVNAHNGILRGKITDSQTGESLIGATVIITGTSVGASTDIDGNFDIEDIKPGIYQIDCRFISYKPVHITNVKIEANKITVKNIILYPISLGLNEVEIKAKTNRKTETALLTIQKKSSNVIEGLSAQQISNNGDGNAAAALKRVTGINVSDGKYVYVRGLSDRYSKTTLNNADIPGLDPNKNTVQMDIFPTALIENIIIYKSFSPNLPGDFTGGLVNIETRDFPEKFTLNASINLGYNTNASFNKNFLSYEGSPFDIFGFDNGFRAIPKTAQGKLPEYPNNKNLLTAITEKFNKIMEPVKQPSGANENISFSIGNQKRIGKHKKQSLGYIFGLSYKKNNSFYDNGIKALYKLGGTSDTTLIEEHKYKDTQGQTEYLWGTLLNISYKPNGNQKLGINFFKNQSGISTARYLIGKKPSDEADLYVETRKLGWLERSLNMMQINGKHYFKKLNEMKINWIGSVAYSYQNEPDMRFFTNSFFPTNENKFRYSIQSSIYAVPARYYRYLKETNYNIKTNIFFNIIKKPHSPKLKFGGNISKKYRDFSEKRFDYRFQFSQYTYNGNINDFISNKNIGSNFAEYNNTTGRNFGIYIQGNSGDDLKNSYRANQTIGAAYVMIDATIANKLHLSTGIRFEHTTINSASKDSTLQAGYLNNNDMLPALNLTYYFNDNIYLRLNLSRTLARPNFRELAPYASFNFAGGEVYVGNPNLKRTLIDNIDIRWENYLKPGEIISFGAFYKNFSNPIELTDNPKAQNTELSWENVNRAIVYGLELNVMKKLDFWNFTKNIKTNINFSFIHSKVAINPLELEAIRASNPSAKNYRPMGGQSPYILNVSVEYNNKKSKIKSNIAYNVTGPRIMVIVKGSTPNIYEQPFHSLNINLKKQLSKNFILQISMENLLNSSFTETYTFRNKEYIYRSYKTGITFEAGLNYKF